MLPVLAPQMWLCLGQLVNLALVLYQRRAPVQRLCPQHPPRRRRRQDNLRWSLDSRLLGQPDRRQVLPQLQAQFSQGKRILW